jgi:hypothetical protein
LIDLCVVFKDGFFSGEQNEVDFSRTYRIQYAVQGLRLMLLAS